VQYEEEEYEAARTKLMSCNE